MKKKKIPDEMQIKEKLKQAEIRHSSDLEEPLKVPEDDPDIIPEDDPFENPPAYEKKVPGEGPL